MNFDQGNRIITLFYGYVNYVLIEIAYIKLHSIQNLFCLYLTK